MNNPAVFCVEGWISDMKFRYRHINGLKTISYIYEHTSLLKWFSSVTTGCHQRQTSRIIFTQTSNPNSPATFFSVTFMCRLSTTILSQAKIEQNLHSHRTWKHTLRSTVTHTGRALCSLSLRKEVLNSQWRQSLPHLGLHAFVRVDEPGC